MSAPKAEVILLLLFASFATQSHAATVFAAGTKTVEACAFAVNPTAKIVSNLHYPAAWKIVVVCNENMWDTLMRQANVNFVSNYAFTFQPNHVTFIRAKIFLERMTYTPEQVLEHELGHIMCKRDGEAVAWKLATR